MTSSGVPRQLGLLARGQKARDSATHIKPWSCLTTHGWSSSRSSRRTSERSGKDRAQIARWEADVVQPNFETLRELIRACGFDLELNFVPYAVDEQETKELRHSLLQTPQERLSSMLKARGR